MTDRHDVDLRARRMDELIHRLESEGDPGVRATARELVQALLEFHADGLNRVMEIVDEAGPAGAAIIDRLGEDELVTPLLLLHGLHPVDLHTRVIQAVGRTRPALQAHGGGVEVVGVDEDGVVTLQLDTHGCGASTGTLRTTLEEALREAAPDLTRLVIEPRESGAESSGTVAFVPVGELLRSRAPVERSVD